MDGIDKWGSIVERPRARRTVVGQTVAGSTGER